MAKHIPGKYYLFPVPLVIQDLPEKELTRDQTNLGLTVLPKVRLTDEGG